jgi:hypothetical protein
MLQRMCSAGPRTCAWIRHQTSQPNFRGDARRPAWSDQYYAEADTACLALDVSPGSRQRSLQESPVQSFEVRLVTTAAARSALTGCGSGLRDAGSHQSRGTTEFWTSGPSAPVTLEVPARVSRMPGVHPEQAGGIDTCIRVCRWLA